MAEANERCGAILFFDGVCGLCNSFVDLLLSEDRRRVLRVTPLQGLTAQELLPRSLRDGDLSTVVYRHNGITYERSAALLRVLHDIGGIWKLAVLFRLIPAPLRDMVYDLVARKPALPGSGEGRPAACLRRKSVTASCPSGIPIPSVWNR